MRHPTAIVAKALREGKLVKQPCGVCGEAEVEAHHPDYDKPLEVVWLCKKHHHAEHVRLREVGHVIPNTPKPRHVVTISNELHSVVANLADEEDRKFTDMARILIEDGLEKRGKWKH